ncbi:MAG TPA: protein kinase [Thermoanaerobaculia bacterium]
MAAEPQRNAQILSAPALRGFLEIGPYQVLEDLGPAPFGTVHLAVDTRSDRLIYLKAIPPSRPGSWQEETGWEILLAETEALGRIYHRGIPRVLEIAEHEGCLVVAFDMAEGRSLREILRSGERLNRAVLIGWGRQILDALAEAHAQGVLHRHLTEEAVVVGPGGGVVLTGFGLTEVAFGPAAVLPPEQMAGELYTAQSDLYAVGSLLRRLAFASSLKGDPLLKILARATSPNPAARYESAAEMADALRDAARAGGPSRSQGRPQGAETEPRQGAALRLIAAPSRFASPPPLAGAEDDGQVWRTLVLLVTSLLLVIFFLAAGWLLFEGPENKNPGGSLPRVDLPPLASLKS